MKQSLSGKMRTAFFRSIRFKWIIVLMVVICLIFLLTYTNYQHISRRKGLQKGYELYGEYQVSLRYVPQSALSKIPDVKSAVKSCYFAYNQKTEGYRSAAFYYVPENFFDMYCFSICEGRFPANKSEVMCEKDYFDRKMSGTEIGKSTITLNGKEYTVSGTFKSQSNWFFRSDGVNPEFLFSFDNISEEERANSEYNILFYAGPDKEEILKKEIDTVFSLYTDNVCYNYDALDTACLSFTSKGTKLLPTDPLFIFCDAMIYVIMLCMAILISSFLNLSVTACKRNATVFNAIGISQKMIKRQLFHNVLLMTVPASLVVPVVALTVDFAILRDFEGWEKLLLKNYSMTAIFTVLICVFTLPSLFRKEKTSVSASLSNKDNVFTAQHTVKNPGKLELNRQRFPFLKIAKNSISRKKNKRFFSVVGLAFAMIITSSFLYLWQHSTATWGELRFDYRVEIDHNTANLSEEKHRAAQEYDELLKNENFEFFQYRFCMASAAVQKEKVSKEYKDYLVSSDSSAFAIFDRPSVHNINLDAIILSADKDTVSSLYGLSSDYVPEVGKCVIVSSIQCFPKGEIRTGLKKGDTVHIYKYGTEHDDSDSWPSFEIKKTLPAIDFPLMEKYYSFIILVNQNDYKSLNIGRNDEYPSVLYMNGDSSQAEAFFKNCSYMKAVDLTLDRKELQKTKTITETVIYSMSTMLLFIITFSSILDFINKYRRNEKQMAILKALGVPTEKRLIYIAYEYVSSLPLTVILGIAGSVFGEFLVSLLMSKMLDMISGFRVIWWTILIPLVLIVASYLIMIPIAWKKAENMNVTEILQKDN